MLKIGNKVKVVRDTFAENGCDEDGNPYVSNFVGHTGVIVNVYPEYDKKFEVAEEGDQFGYCFSEEELQLIH